MTRIISGLAGSLTLKVPKSGTRPTSDRVREAIFSTLEAWDALENATVLDLFAGSGALGLEAASRGAKSVLMLEKHAPTVEVIKQNTQLFKKAAARHEKKVDLKVVRGSANTFFTEQGSAVTWDLVFIDPPYDFRDESLNTLLSELEPLLNPEAVVMVERGSKSAAPVWPAGVEEIRHKRYGDTTVYWAEKTIPTHN